MVIRSLDNEKVKKYCKLKNKKYREEYGEFIVEGEHLVLEAYRKGLLKEVILEENEAMPLAVPYVLVTYDIIKKISDLKTPGKILGLCKIVKETTIGNRILVLDHLQDPGNVGTIIRSAVAFGIDTIIFGKETVDPYNPKVIRATQGMLFHVPLVFFDIGKLLPLLKGLSIPIYGTRVQYGVEVDKLTLEEKSRFALIVGNEGNGVLPHYLEKCDKNIYIPMDNEVESLNVAIATSIILYEMRNK